MSKVAAGSDALKQSITSALRVLDVQQRTVLRLRFGLDGYSGEARSHGQIAMLTGMTVQEVRSIETEALRVIATLGETTRRVEHAISQAISADNNTTDQPSDLAAYRERLRFSFGIRRGLHGER